MNPLESPVRRFAMLWGLSEADQRKQVWAVIETYYPYNAFVDESIQERHGIKATGVAAYVATFDNWLKLEQEWRGILDFYKVPLDGKKGHDQPCMHMTDFIARKVQFENDWSDQKRNDFMERLTMTISEHTIVGISVSVIDADFERALDSGARGFWREPYFFCLWGTMTNVMSLDDRFEGMAIPYPLWFLLGDRQKARAFGAELFHAARVLNGHPERFGSVGFGAAWRTPQIQAADLLAYESARRRIELKNNPKVAMRPSLKKLIRKDKVLLMEMNEQNLRKYMQFVSDAPRADQASKLINN